MVGDIPKRFLVKVLLLSLFSSHFFLPHETRAESCALAFLPRRGTPPKLRTLTELRIGTYNVLDLNFAPSNPAYHFRQKAHWEHTEIANVIRQADLDIVVLQEIRGRDALQRFSRDYLKNRYRPLLIEAATTDMDIGFLVKSDLPLFFELRTHQDRVWSHAKRSKKSNGVLTRDIPALIIRKEKDGPPLLVVLGAHFRSSSKRPDEAKLIREAEAREAARIIQSLQTEFNDAFEVQTRVDVPILLGGDFNSDIHQSSEFRPLLRDMNLSESMDVLGTPRNKNSRTTFSLIRGDGASHAQLDAFLLNRALRQRRALKASFVFRYWTPEGYEKPLPETKWDRSTNPSDHSPVIAIFDFEKLLQPTSTSGPEIDRERDDHHQE